VTKHSHHIRFLESQEGLDGLCENPSRLVRDPVQKAITVLVLQHVSVASKALPRFGITVIFKVLKLVSPLLLHHLGIGRMSKCGPLVANYVNLHLKRTLDNNASRARLSLMVNTIKLTRFVLQQL